MIIERVKAGLKRAKAQRKILGRPWIGLDIEARVLSLREKGAGLRKIGRTLTDLVITDIYMPDRDGLEVFENAAPHEATFEDSRHLRGVRDQGLLRQATAADVVAVLRKPLPCQPCSKSCGPPQ